MARLNGHNKSINPLRNLIIAMITLDGKEKGLGISAEPIGHLARNLASILIEDRNDVKARYTLFVPIFQRVFHNAEPERALGLQKLYLLVRHPAGRLARREIKGM